ncbi:hypothetical protein [Sphingomicrobium astaxanthinifaciens]|uniref:hypothetical protein n=1 Tax=Sphingomicrobium astaxanthinifaciens TaxID=1227949 RepID=UPI001FCB73AC|nr:hypothetical protein [Sphingomicrobium astaxanthinifaciens]MCJ7421851.1 hypothetical protein [Sphingomicrobium astaxanthinifaciens]
MYSQQELDDAVAAGALTSQSANALRAFVAQQRSSSLVDEEQFRLITGFNDIFVAVAGAILFFAVGWIGQWLGDQLGFQVGGDFGPSPLAGLAIALTAWGLALYFTAKRRMALPSILFLLAFVGGTFWAASMTLGIVAEGLVGTLEERGAGIIAATAAAITAAAAWLHWRTFRVPITVAAGAVAVAGIVLGLTAAIIGDSVPGTSLMTIILWMVLLLGLGIFAVAMKWDASDPARVTRRSDVAFWLHLAAAPMIVHAVFTLLALNDANATMGEGFLVIGLYLLLGLAAIAIDRRALLVSALAYVLYALAALFREFGAVELNIALTALVIGSALLLLSAFWHQARHKVVAMLPHKVRRHLPDLHGTVPAAVSPEPAA